MDSAKAYKQYQDALQALSTVADSRKTAFNAASGLYSEDPATGESPFFMARQGEKKLRMVLGKKNKQTDLFWDLINGPIQFYHAYVIREAQCQLQSIWEKEVFLEVQYVSSGMDLNKLLMGNDGYAIKFVKGPAAPFIDRSRGKGYHARSIAGRSLDFRTDFLTFLTRGESVAKPVVANYRVSIKAYPTDANSKALVKPHATKLELQCGNERNQLINLHYPVRKTFNWSAQSCGDVIFKIEIGNLVLTTVYDGYLGFPRFLNDFKTGQRTFRPGDFPEQAAALKRMRITKITAKYQLSGHKPVLRFLQASPGRVPQEITSCWEN